MSILAHDFQIVIDQEINSTGNGKCRLCIKVSAKIPFDGYYIELYVTEDPTKKSYIAPHYSITNGFKSIAE